MESYGGNNQNCIYGIATLSVPTLPVPMINCFSTIVVIVCVNVWVHGSFGCDARFVTAYPYMRENDDHHHVSRYVTRYANCYELMSCLGNTLPTAYN